MFIAVQLPRLRRLENDRRNTGYYKLLILVVLRISADRTGLYRKIISEGNKVLRQMTQKELLICRTYLRS